MNRSTENKFILCFVSLASVSTSAMANLARNDIDWDNYANFALNRGKFEVGNTNIVVYKSNDTQSGVIAQAMPGFYDVVDGGNAALYDDNQVLESANHVGFGGISFNRRFFRKDVNLYGGYLDSQPKQNYDRFSEDYQIVKRYTTENPQDVVYLRANHVIFDGIPNEVLKPIQEASTLHEGSLVAHVGAGSNQIAVDWNVEKFGKPYGFLAGGLNTLDHVGFWNGNVYAKQSLEKAKPHTPLDASSQKGDSGSPAYVWDPIRKKWLLFASNSNGSGSGYGKNNQFRGNPKFGQSVVQGLNTNVDSKVVTLDQGTAANTFKLNNEVKSSGADAPNQVFTQDGTHVTVNGHVDTGVTRVEFQHNATIEGEGTLSTAGLVVDEGATVNYNLGLDAGQDLRKIGKGKLVVNGAKGNNLGILSIGDGIVELNHQGGFAASNIRIATGRATVRLVGKNQINGSNVSFGTLGGVLDLNGHDLTFNEIYHMDKGATFANSNTRGATFNYVNAGKRVYLGNFKENINIIYDSGRATTPEQLWDLRGNDTNITGDFVVNHGNLQLSGDNVINGYEAKPDANNYFAENFTAKAIVLKNDSSLTLGRASHTNAPIQIGKDASLAIQANGWVDEQSKPWFEDQKVGWAVDVNKITTSQDITFAKTGPVNPKNAFTPLGFDQSQANFKVNLEYNNIAELNGNLSGFIQGYKTGTGKLIINSSDNPNLNGKLVLDNGTLSFAHLNGMGNIAIYSNNPGAVLEVGGVTSTTISSLLQKINPGFAGVLSIDSNLEALPTAFLNYHHLSLGTSGDITIGSKGRAFDKNLGTLNFGGNGGTVRLLGLSVGNSKRLVNLGNSKTSSKIYIDEIKNENRILLNVNGRTDVNIAKNDKDNFVNLGYGSTLNYKNYNALRATSIGTVLADGANTDEQAARGRYDLSDTPELSLGAVQGTEVQVNNLKVADGQAYRLSGQGTLVLNNKLESGHNLIVDGEYMEGGDIRLAADNSNYKGKILVTGNDLLTRNALGQGGAIQLSLAAGNALGVSNTLDVKDGGTLNLNGHQAKVVIGEENNARGLIVNHNKTEVKLSIDNSNNVVVNNELQGNIDLHITGGGCVTLANSDSRIEGDYNVDNGTLVYAADIANHENDDSADNRFVVNKDGVLKVQKDIRGTIIFNTEGSTKPNLLLTNKDEPEAPSYVTLSNIHANADLAIQGDNSTKLTIANGQLDGHTVKIADLNLSTNKHFDTAGNLDLHNVVWGIRDYNNPILSSANLKQVDLTNSTIFFTDYGRFANGEIKHDADATKIVLHGQNYFQGNGGAGVTLNENVEVTDGSTLTFVYNNLYGQHHDQMKLNLNLSGTGTVNFNYAAFDAGDNVYNNWKDFHGTFDVTQPFGNSRLDYLGYSLRGSQADRTLSYRLVGDNQARIKNISNDKVYLENVNDYQGYLLNGDHEFVLSGEQALHSHLTLQTDNNAYISADKGVSVNFTNTTIQRQNWNKDSHITIQKVGEGEISIQDSVRLENVTEANVQAGTLGLDTDPHNSILYSDKFSYVVAKDAALRVERAGDYNFNASVSGEGNFEVKTGLGSILRTSTKYLQNTGYVNIFSGKLVLDLAGGKILFKGVNLLDKDASVEYINSSTNEFNLVSPFLAKNSPYLDKTIAGMDLSNGHIAPSHKPSASTILPPKVGKANLGQPKASPSHFESAANNQANNQINTQAGSGSAVPKPSVQINQPSQPSHPTVSLASGSSATGRAAVIAPPLVKPPKVTIGKPSVPPKPDSSNVLLTETKPVPPAPPAPPAPPVNDHVSVKPPMPAGSTSSPVVINPVSHDNTHINPVITEGYSGPRPATARDLVNSGKVDLSSGTPVPYDVSVDQHDKVNANVRYNAYTKGVEEVSTGYNEYFTTIGDEVLFNFHKVNNPNDTRAHGEIDMNGVAPRGLMYSIDNLDLSKSVIKGTNNKAWIGNYQKDSPMILGDTAHYNGKVIAYNGDIVLGKADNLNTDALYQANRANAYDITSDKGTIVTVKHVNFEAPIINITGAGGVLLTNGKDRQGHNLVKFNGTSNVNVNDGHLFSQVTDDDFALYGKDVTYNVSGNGVFSFIGINQNVTVNAGIVGSGVLSIDDTKNNSEVTFKLDQIDPHVKLRVKENSNLGLELKGGRTALANALFGTGTIDLKATPTQDNAISTRGAQLESLEGGAVPVPPVVGPDDPTTKNIEVNSVAGLSHFGGKLNLENNTGVNFNINKGVITGFDITSAKDSNTYIRNKNASDLTLTNIKDFNGKVIAVDGNITLRGDEAFNTNATVYSMNGHAIGLESTANDGHYQDVNNLKVESAKVFKTGTGDLRLLNVHLEKTKDFEVKKGGVIFTNGIHANQNLNFNLDENANLIFNSNQDLNFNYHTSGSGRFIVYQTGGHSVTANIENIGKDNQIQVESGKLNLHLTKDHIVSSEYSGSGDFVVSAEGDTLRHFTFTDTNQSVELNGNFTIGKNVELDFNINNGGEAFFNVLAGQDNPHAEIHNKNTSRLSLDGVKNFTGKIVADAGDILLRDDATATKATLEGNGKHAIGVANGQLLTDSNYNPTAEKADARTLDGFTVHNASEFDKYGDSDIKVNNLHLIDTAKVSAKQGNLILGTAVNSDNNPLTYDIESKACLTLQTQHDLDLTKDNISGSGTLVVDQKDHKATIEFSKLGSNTGIELASGTLEAKVSAGENNQLTQTISGTGELQVVANEGASADKPASLTVTDQTKLSQFTGKVALTDHTALDFNLQNGEVTPSYAITSAEGVDAQIRNINTSNLTLTDISHFNGKVVAAKGDIILKGDKAFNTKANIDGNFTHNIGLETTKDQQTSDGLKVANAAKVEKLGTGTLTLTNASFGSVDTVAVNGGTLKLGTTIKTSTRDDVAYDIAKDAKLELNTQDKDLDLSHSTVSGKGTLVIDQTAQDATVDLSFHKLGADTGLDIEHGTLQAQVEKGKVLTVTQHLSGNGDLLIKGIDAKPYAGNLNDGTASSDTDHGVLSFTNKDTLKDFHGNLQIGDHGGIEFNMENGEVNGGIIAKSADAQISNGNATSLTFNDLSSFNGKVLADKGDIVLKGAKALNTQAHFQGNATHGFNLEVTEGKVDSEKLTIKDAQVAKTGAGDLTLGAANFDNVTDFTVNQGNLILKDKVTDTSALTYELKQGTSLQVHSDKDFDFGTDKVTGTGKLVINQTSDTAKVDLNLANLGQDTSLELDKGVFNGHLTAGEHNLTQTVTGTQNFNLVKEGTDPGLGSLQVTDLSKLANYQGKFALGAGTSLDYNIGTQSLDNLHVVGGAASKDYLVRNTNSTNLTITNTGDYQGKLVAQAGDLVLKGTALQTQATLSSTAEHKVHLNVEAGTASAGTLKAESANLVKDGTGSLTLGTVDFDHVKDLEVTAGKLEVTQHLNTHDQDLNVQLGKDTGLVAKGSADLDLTNLNVKGDGSLVLEQTNPHTNVTVKLENIASETQVQINSGNLVDSLSKGEHQLTTNISGSADKTVYLVGDSSTSDNLNGQDPAQVKGLLEVSDQSKLANFQGTFAIGKGAGLDFNLNNGNLSSYKFVSTDGANAQIRNLNSSILTFNNLTGFGGTVVAAHGDVKLLGLNAFNTQASFTAQNGHQILLESSQAQDQAQNIVVQTVKNLNVHDAALSKVGDGYLALSQTNFTNVTNFNIDKGGLILTDKVNNKVNGQVHGLTYNLSNNANLVINADTDYDFTDSSLTGNGSFVVKQKHATNNVTVDLQKFASNTSIYLISGNLNVSLAKGNTELHQILRGSTSNIYLSANSQVSDTDQASLVVKDLNDFKHFTGNLNIGPKADLAFDLNNGTVKDLNILATETGKGTIRNINSSELTFENLQQFTGKVVADKGDVTLDGWAALNSQAQFSANAGHFINLKAMDSKGPHGRSLAQLSRNLHVVSGDIQKTGDGALVLKDAKFDQVTNFNLKGGSLYLQSQITGTNAAKVTYNLAASTKFIFNAKENIDFSHATLNGDASSAYVVAQNDHKGVVIDYSKLNSNGQFYLKSGSLDLELSAGTHKLNHTFSGTGNLILNGVGKGLEQVERQATMDSTSSEDNPSLSSLGSIGVSSLERSTSHDTTSPTLSGDNPAVSGAQPIADHTDPNLRGNLEIDDNAKGLSQFTGKLIVGAGAGLDYNLTNGNISGYQLIAGDGIKSVVRNINSTTLTFTDLSNYRGTIDAAKGDVTLKGMQAFNTNAVFTAENGKAINLDVEAQAPTLISPVMGASRSMTASLATGLRVDSATLNKIGEGNLALSQASFNNVSNVNVKAGSLILKDQINNTRGINYKLDVETQLIVNSKNNLDLSRDTVTGNGDLIVSQEGNHQVALDLTKLQLGRGKVQILAGIVNAQLRAGTLTTLNQTFTGNGVLYFTNGGKLAGAESKPIEAVVPGVHTAGGTTATDLEHALGHSSVSEHIPNVDVDKFKAFEPGQPLPSNYAHLEINNTVFVDGFAGEIRLGKDTVLDFTNSSYGYNVGSSSSYFVSSDQSAGTSAIIRNMSKLDLSFSNLNNFTGTVIAQNGNITLDGVNALSTRAHVLTEAQHIVNLHVEKGENVVSDGLHVSSLQIVKTGEGVLNLQDANFNDTFDFVVQSGGVILHNNIYNANTGKFHVTAGTALGLDLGSTNAPDYFLGSVKGEGSVILLSSATVNTAQFDSNITINTNSHNLNLIVTDNNVLPRIIGSGKVKARGMIAGIDDMIIQGSGSVPAVSTYTTNSEGELVKVDLSDNGPYGVRASEGSSILPSINGPLVNGVDGAVETSAQQVSPFDVPSNLIIDHSLDSFTGIFETEKNLHLVIKGTSRNIDMITGSGEVVSDMGKNSRPLIFVDHKGFNGSVVAENGDIAVVGDKLSADPTYVVNHSNLILASSGQDIINLNKFKVKNNSQDNYFVSAGDQTVEMNAQTAKAVKNFAVDGGVLHADTDIALQSLANAGTVKLGDHNLSVVNYDGQNNRGLIDLNVIPSDQTRIHVAGSSSKIRLKLNINSDEAREALRLGKIRLSDAKADLEITNLDQLNNGRSYKIVLADGDIGSVVSDQSLDIFNSISAAQTVMDFPDNAQEFTDSVSARTIQSNFESKDFKQYIYSPNTHYRTSSSVNGYGFTFGKNFELGKFEINPILDLHDANIDTKTEVRNLGTTHTNSEVAGANLRVNVKYGDWVVRGGLGLNSLIFGKGDSNYHVNYLRTAASLGYQPEFEIGKGFSFKFTNELGTVINPIINQNISHASSVFRKISSESPYSFFYKLGADLNQEYFSFGVSGKVTYDLSKLYIATDHDKVSNELNDKVTWEGSTHVDFYMGKHWSLDLQGFINNSNKSINKTGQVAVTFKF